MELHDLYIAEHKELFNPYEIHPWKILQIFS